MSESDPGPPMHLAAFGNTYNACLVLLHEKGFELATDSGDYDDAVRYHARKGQNTFAAGSPPELLGLVTLWEHFGRDWFRDEPWMFDRIRDLADDERT